jgi:hypothetical protein
MADSFDMALPTVNSFGIDVETFDQAVAFSEGVKPVQSRDRRGESMCSSPHAISRSNFPVQLFECFEELFSSMAGVALGAGRSRAAGSTVKDMH